MGGVGRRPSRAAMLAPPGLRAHRMAFMRALIHADTLTGIARALRHLLRACVDDVHVALWWSAGSGIPTLQSLRCAPPSARAWADAPGAFEVLHGGAMPLPPAGAQRACLTFPLAAFGASAAVVQIELARNAPPNIERLLAATDTLPLLARRVSELLQLRQVAATMRRSLRDQRLQRSLFALADLASAGLERDEMLRRVHAIVASLMYAENFFIVLYDASRRTLRWVYFVDSVDPDTPDPDTEYAEDGMGNSLTLALLHHGEPLMGPSEDIRRRFGVPHDPTTGPDSEDWLGVPMVSDGEVRGAIVVQSYDPARRYRKADRVLLSFVAQHILNAMTRRQAREELQREVDLRTRELAESNRVLQHEVDERQSGERLQAALFRIAEVTSTADSLQAFYSAVHAIVADLIYARNFFVALLVDNDTHFDFPYVADEFDSPSMFQRRPLRRGLSEYVLRTGHTLRAGRDEINHLMELGEIQRIGSPSACWLGVPLLIDNRNVGVLVVQSYREDVIYAQRDQELLEFVSLHIATAMQRRQAQKALAATNAELEKNVLELKRTQSELIHAEKMASLGSVVAGVAHEINTPLGVSVTAASHLDETIKALEKSLAAGRAPNVAQFAETARQCTDLVLRNLERADKLVRSFKQVAVDQSAETVRPFELKSYIDEVLLSLSPQFKRTRHQVVVNCPTGIGMVSYPGALYQILTNLVTNSLIHAFDAAAEGTITISAELDGDTVRFMYRDDGRGMSPDAQRRVFEPFFTTRRGQGGSGLGMHIAFNLVTTRLGGTIRCESTPGAGVLFDFAIPLRRA